ncbi:MAG: hypothetical protein IJC09_01525 [Clostridia bacterium]|nr:hypothetical protein [Clostridia bacterium]
MSLQLGISRVDITPEIGGHLYGYNPYIFSNSVNDPLEATAFVFSDGDKQFALINATLVAVGREVSDATRKAIEKETGIPFDNISICATHTHSGPSTKYSPGWGEPDTDYCYGILLPQLVKATCEAAANKTAVKMGFAAGESYAGINRLEWDGNNIILGQNPWGVFNPKMVVISFKDFDDNNVATLVHYGVHPTSAGPNKEITRDWPGIMTDRLSRETGCPVAFLQGPEGDTGPRLSNGKTIGEKPNGEVGDISYIYEPGNVAALDAVRIYKQIDTYLDVDMDYIVTEVKMPVDKRMSIEEAEKWIGYFERNEGNDYESVQTRSIDYYKQIIASYDTDFEEVEYATIEQTVLRLGDIALVTSPYELFCEIGLRVNDLSPFAHTLMLVNTNDTYAYFPTTSAIPCGGYEIALFLTSRIQPYTAPADWNYIKGTVENVKKLK